MALRSMLTLAVFLALAFPATAQQDGIQNPHTSTPTTLYMHLDGIQDFPINTQPPDDRYQKGNAYGLLTTTGSCAGGSEGTGAATGSWHTYYGYSSPGYVQYDFDEDGKPRYHKERGLSFDVDLDTTSPFTTYWYLETQAVASDMATAANNVPVLVPNVVVKATMRSGDDVDLGDEGFNEGEVIAEGRTDPVVMGPATTDGHPHVSHHEVDGKQVYRFAVPMEYRTDRIDRDESYNIRLDVFIENPACDDPTAGDERSLMANHVRVHTSPDHRPRMELAIMNPLRIESIHPMFLGDEMVIHTRINSPWGNYDVGEPEGTYATPGALLFSIDGPTAATEVKRLIVQHKDGHHRHQEPMEVTYLWAYQDDGAQDGVYTVRLEATNDQETATAVGEARFQIGQGGLPPCDPEVPAMEQYDCAYSRSSTDGKQSPGVGLFALLGALAAAFLVRRRG